MGETGCTSSSGLVTKGKRFPDGRDRLRAKLGLALMGRAILSKPLIWFSVDGRRCVPSLLSDQIEVEVRKIMADLLQKVSCTLPHSVPWPCSRSLSIHTSTGGSWTHRGKSGSVSCGVTAPFSWVLVCTRFCWWAPSLFPQSCVNKIL